MLLNLLTQARNSCNTRARERDRQRTPLTHTPLHLSLSLRERERERGVLVASPPPAPPQQPPALRCPRIRALSLTLSLSRCSLRLSTGGNTRVILAILKPTHAQVSGVL